MDLAAAKLRVKKGGGDAGQNGLRSITAALGPDYRRVRIGIGHPGEKSRVTGHVLQNFSKRRRGMARAACWMRWWKQRRCWPGMTMPGS